MQRYGKEFALPIYNVDKELIAKIEQYILRRLPKAIQVTKELSSSLRITIQTKDSTRTFSSINKYDFELFEGNIQHINIELVFINALEYITYKIIAIDLTFSRKSDQTILCIGAYSDTPDELITAIKEGILLTIKHKKSIVNYIYPTELIWGPLLVITAFIGFYGLYTDNAATRLLCMTISGSILFYLLSFKFLKGYCYFNSLKDKRINSALKWGFGLIIGFAVTTSLKTIRKALFGF